MYYKLSNIFNLKSGFSPLCDPAEKVALRSDF